MTVGRILAAKGRDVATINPQCSVAEAAQILARKRIGAIVIVDGEGAVAGIFSERDIVRLLNAKGAAALQDEVANWMTRTVVTTSQSASVHSLMEQMTAGPLSSCSRGGKRRAGGHRLHRRRGEAAPRRNGGGATGDARIYRHRLSALFTQSATGAPARRACPRDDKSTMRARYGTPCRRRPARP